VVRTHELGSSGLEVSRVGLGSNNFGRRLDLDGTRAVVDAALAAGITLIDTADIYGGGKSEQFLGEILEGRCDQVVLATKFGMGDGGNGSREYLRRSIAGSLERLRTDHVELYYYHRPAVDDIHGYGPVLMAGAEVTKLVTNDKLRIQSGANRPNQVSPRGESQPARE
jgi:aryl-alcohol dehydrogenase-like predicted oxidoreductase